MRRITSPIEINQDPSAAAHNRARIASDRLALVQHEERRVYRYEQRLAQARRPIAIAKATRKLKAARERLAQIRINGSRLKGRRKP